jgi:transcriptional regulator GlxA family with amidase domain
MNLFKAFRVRSGKTRQTIPLDALDQFASEDIGFTGELTLQEILSDPVTRSMMARDQVSPADIERMFRAHDRAAA